MWANHQAARKRKQVAHPWSISHPQEADDKDSCKWFCWIAPSEGKRSAYAPILGHCGASSRSLANSYSLFSISLVVATKFPERIAEIMSYQSIIAMASQKCRWLCWVIYDQKFRQAVGGNLWTKVDPSIYGQCFTGHVLSTESWCVRCHSLDHTSAIPLRSWNTAMGSAATSVHGARSCIKGIANLAVTFVFAAHARKSVGPSTMFILCSSMVL